jgi:itaconate CoA-transferase
VGPLRGLLLSAMLGGQEPVMTPIPEVGEHNEKILAELGYEDVETTAPGRDGATSAKEA